MRPELMAEKQRDKRRKFTTEYKAEEGHGWWIAKSWSRGTKTGKNAMAGSVAERHGGTGCVVGLQGPPKRRARVPIVRRLSVRTRI
jgi:hypothetical protein